METDPASTRSLEFQVLEQVAKPGMEESDDSLMTLSASQVGNFAYEEGHSPRMAALLLRSRRGRYKQAGESGGRQSWCYAKASRLAWQPGGEVTQ